MFSQINIKSLKKRSPRPIHEKIRDNRLIKQGPSPYPFKNSKILER